MTDKCGYCRVISEKEDCEQCLHNVNTQSLNELLCDFKEAIKNGFMTCESSPDGLYEVRIKTKTLVDAQKLHKLLIGISNI